MGVALNLFLDWVGWDMRETPDMENEIYELHAELYAFSTTKNNQSKRDGCVSRHISCTTHINTKQTLQNVTIKGSKKPFRTVSSRDLYTLAYLRSLSP